MSASSSSGNSSPMTSSAVRRRLRGSGFGSAASGSESKGIARRLQALDDVHDVLVEGHAKLLRALLELVARHLPGEALVAHLLGDRSDVDLVEAAVGPDVSDGDDEAGHLVAGVHRAGEE